MHFGWRSNSGQELQLDVVQAYDRIADEYARLTENRRVYLSRVEEIVLAGIPPGSASLLDVGSGDGVRAVRIAQAASISHLVLLEPSPAMRRLWPDDVTAWAMRAEELSTKSESFDVITCLWNVLGHIFPAHHRLSVLRHCARLLAPAGRMFVDLNYRYNAQHYGFLQTGFRVLQDLARPNEKNGDVRVRWHIQGKTYETAGHVFTHREFETMARAAGFFIEKQVTVNYKTGRLHRFPLSGNPLYTLRKAAAPQAG